MGKLLSRLALVLGLCIFVNAGLYAKDVYVDANKGDDNNPGTLLEPFKTIQKAADIMAVGDVCYIRCGVYREKVQVNTSGLTFSNYNNEYVLITGLDVISGANFTDHEGGILKTAVDSKVTQVFIAGKRMNLARWPNEDGNMLNRDDMVQMDVDLIKRGDRNVGKVTVMGGELPERPKNFWAGAYVVDVALKRNIFTANKGQIYESEGNELFADKLCWTWARGNPIFLNDGGVGYIIDHLGLLDVEGEWYCGDNELYVYPPKGVNLGEVLVEVRKRTFGFVLKNTEDVTLSGLNFKAAAIQMRHTTNCHIEKCTSRFGSPFIKYLNNAWGNYGNGDAAIHITGTNNTVKESYVGYTWGHGISLWGAHSTVDNNIVEQCNWIGERMSPLFVPGDDHIITRNTIRDSGREGIELGNHNWVRKYAKRALIQYNHIHHVGYLCPDAASIYVNHQGGDKPLADTEISYNIIHDFQHPWVSAAGGVYLDNGSSGYLVHHNLIWNIRVGVRVHGGANPDTPKRYARDIEIYNNTLLNTKYEVEMPLREGEIRPQNIVVKNNHGNYFIKRPPWNKLGFQGTELDANRDHIKLSEFVNDSVHNYLLKPESPSIDAGVVLPGITDTGDGAAVGLPDIGAFEYGGVDWRDKVGATISVPEFNDAAVCGFSTSSDLSLSSSISVFPNPMVNSLTIDLGDRKDEVFEYKLSTVGGVLIRSGKIDIQTQTLDVSMLNEGLYIIELLDGKQNLLYSQKIIKN